jgi:hypothetical protein
MDISISHPNSATPFKLNSIKFRPDPNGLCGQFELFDSADGPKIAASTRYLVQPFALTLLTSSSHAGDNVIDFTHVPDAAQGNPKGP